MVEQKAGACQGYLTYENAEDAVRAIKGRDQTFIGENYIYV